MRYLRLMLVPLLLVACSDTQDALNQSPQLDIANAALFSGPSANGQAKLPREYFGGLQTVAFQARQMPDGSVRGTMESKSRAQDTEIHVVLDCLAISGTEAILGGIVTQSRSTLENPPVVGERIWFKVLDNGEGAAADPDEFSDWFYVGALFLPDFTITACEPNPYVEFPGFIPDFLPVEAGNIQVKP